MKPTSYFRILVRMEIDTENSTHEYAAQKEVDVLQQFWQHEGGKEAAGDMFVMIMGSWRDVQKVYA